ncbi:MAG: hypothetical protein U5Q44_12300 [Dehalococcoidia bacterium]|nr:hypothetical protein [Dehalococcoidia bacterium]
MKNSRRPDDSRLVYSTDGGRPVDSRPAPGGGKGKARPKTGAAPDVPDDGVVRIHRGKPARGGKPQTLVTGLPGSDADLDATLKKLKQALGTGGSREGRTLLVNGEQRERIRELLEASGHRVKLAGG